MNDSAVPQPTDEAIAEEVQRGNRERYGLLVERYEQKMSRYVRRFLYDADDAADVVQDVFVKAYINIKSFDIKQRFSPWMYRIAHNECINSIKKKKREPLPFFDADALFPHPVARERADDEMQVKQIRLALDRCLKELDAKYREPLILYYFEELEYREISDILRIPVSTVGVRLNRGRVILKERYEARYGTT